jgi:hypothetical protein
MLVRTFDQRVEYFIKSLEKSAGTKITRHIDLLARFGNQLRMPYAMVSRWGIIYSNLELKVNGKSVFPTLSRMGL